jgi:succinoglycan biosynthesis transport protein ExoP
MWFLPDIYESTATIRLERQQVPQAFVQATVTSGLDLRLQTITQQVLSHSRVEGLINRFGLYADMRQRESLEQEAVRKLKSNKSTPKKSLTAWQKTDYPVSPFLALPRI